MPAAPGGITFYRDGSKGSTPEVPTIVEIAEAQIPKSVTPSRIAENIDVFDFELTTDQLAAVDALDTGFRGGPGPDPDTITLATFGREIPEA